MTPGKQWQDETLKLDAIRTRPELQFRVAGLHPQHIKRLEAVLEAGREPMEPVRVARVNQALFLVDGHHRLEAHRRAGKATIAAKVARMSLQEARDHARTANTRHGKGLNRDDKLAIWASFVADGGHLDATGSPKTSRAIAADLGGIWSHETVRQKLRALGLLDEATEFPNGYKPYGGGDEADEAELQLELEAELLDALRTFGGRFGQLDAQGKRRFLKGAQGVLAAIEQGQEPDFLAIIPWAYPLDI